MTVLAMMMVTEDSVLEDSGVVAILDEGDICGERCLEMGVIGFFVLCIYRLKSNSPGRDILHDFSVLCFCDAQHSESTMTRNPK